MGTAVLRSIDSLDNGCHFTAFGSSTPPPRPTPAVAPSPAVKSSSRKVRFSPSKTPSPPSRRRRATVSVKPSFPQPLAVRSAEKASVTSNPRIVMGEVKILKRGESLPLLPYAGPAYWVASPEPSAVPLPAFLLLRAAEAAARSEEATRGLRCLLRLGSET